MGDKSEDGNWVSVDSREVWKVVIFGYVEYFGFKKRTRFFNERKEKIWKGWRIRYELIGFLIRKEEIVHWRKGKLRW